MFGKHLLLHWSRTQQTVALSSVAAELNALCKGAQEAIAARVMTEELGNPLCLRMHTDASAAVGVLNRQGSGRIKHLQIKQLWLQERIKLKELSIIKVPRATNFSDLLTHHWNEREGDQHMSGMGVCRRGTCEAKNREGGSKNTSTLYDHSK